MKAIKLFILALSISLASIQQSKAVVAGGLAIAGVPAAGGVALAGLGSVGGGFLMTMDASSCDGGGCVVFLVMGLLVGGILLDEEGSNFEFSKLELNLASEIGVSTDSLAIYNSEIEEANIIFNEVSSELTADSTVEESKGLWEEYRQYLSPETFEVMTKLVSKAQ
ncbi:hypothetical protein [Halobacteriovorax sp.]|uniref:hypothetical protein n=1 Tax=Halobacteriovorax sp. TaxID=2020862 RepID=UPI003AF30387